LDAFEPPLAPSSESRIKLTANTDLKKFSYKPMAMHISEASGILDDRIEEFQELVQSHYGLDDTAFGNATNQNTREIIAVGRIVSDALEGKINASSLMLETSRRTGAGLRVPLRVESISYEFFPGQIVAIRGINASGEYFSVNEVLEMPLLPASASLPSAIDAWNERLGVFEGQDAESPLHALNVLVAAGPFTADDNLAFEPLHALCEKAMATYADTLILIGPLLDIEHPLLASGDFDLPDDLSVEPDKATLADVFRILVGAPLRQLAREIPSITIILVPSARDAVNKHVSWPQEHFTRKELGLPKQAKMVSNPIALSLNETTVGITAQDILYDLRREEIVVGRPKETDILARLPSHLLQQRHFSPIFPPVDRKALPKSGTEEGLATGTPLDVSFLQLGELDVRRDMLITPSVLTPFAKVKTYVGNIQLNEANFKTLGGERRFGNKSWFSFETQRGRYIHPGDDLSSKVD
jgi:DNA polymerase alpha subunit B